MDIKEKYLKFFEEDFEKYRELFESLKNNQKPHTLFIGCSDSRVIPELITKALPGEIFVVRNIANMVPPYNKTELSVSVSEAIEYAVLVLNVKNIVVCGHSNCGGCAAMHLEDDKFSDKPNMAKWISISKDIAIEAQKLSQDDILKRNELTEQLNIIKQLENLMTYPFIKERVEKEELNIYGWYFIIPTGEVYNYNLNTKKFELIK